MPASERILGHGIDLVEVDRIARMLRAHPRRFPSRCFTRAEQAYAESGRGRAAERYAARFAVKEAVLKSLGTGWSGGLRWTEISVGHVPSGGPTVTLSGRCAEVAAARGILRWHLSITHTAGFALASVIACGGDDRAAVEPGAGPA